MPSRAKIVPLVFLAMSVGLPAWGQSAGTVPVEQDIRRERRLDDRLGIERSPGGGANVAPSNPSGVAGFDGPPGIPGDSVGSRGPLPPNGPGSDF